MLLLTVVPTAVVTASLAVPVPPIERIDLLSHLMTVLELLVELLDHHTDDEDDDDSDDEVNDEHAVVRAIDCCSRSARAGRVARETATESSIASCS